MIPALKAAEGVGSEARRDGRINRDRGRGRRTKFLVGSRVEGRRKKTSEKG